jgi:predicted patatin/cPLA2 family phospholipase
VRGSMERRMPTLAPAANSHSAMPDVRRAVVLCLFFVLASGLGCSVQRACVPGGLLTPESTVDLNSTIQANPYTEREALAASVARLKSGPEELFDPNRKKYNVLALSGGGSYGAFTAGMLNGWTASGQRPQFDIVSGVSTGALIATYAFLGPQYDQTLRQFYTTTTTSEIYRNRFKPAILCSDSFVNSKPLEHVIESTVTPQLLCAVAMAHAEGRRLYIGTTNVDTGRLVIWDMGAIASSGKPNSLALYRQIVLASASPPGFFPPVHIDVSVNGRNYTEMHVDGGTTAQVFFRASMIHIDQAAAAAGQRPLAGSKVYIIVAGKPFPDPKCTEDRALKIASSSIGALTYAQTRNDLIRIYTLTLLTGMDYRVASVPQDWPIHEDSMKFEPGPMRQLFDLGYQRAVTGQAWADVPPVLDASQQSIPRSGTEFLVPLETRLPCDR